MISGIIPPSKGSSKYMSPAKKFDLNTLGESTNLTFYKGKNSLNIESLLLTLDLGDPASEAAVNYFHSSQLIGRLGDTR